MTAGMLCLALAVYFESRGEPIEGQIAVAEVVKNRTESNKFPNTICGVVEEDRGPKKYDCQFSYMCDGKPENPVEGDAWEQAKDVAKSVWNTDSNSTKGSTHFAATYVNNRWTQEFVHVTTIGKHKFYKE